MTGLSRYFARGCRRVQIVLADPAGSVLADYVATRDWHGRLVGRRRDWRRFHSADRRSVRACGVRSPFATSKVVDPAASC